MIRWLILILAPISWSEAQDRFLWQDPGDVEHIDFTYPAGDPKNTPQPPFSFQSESVDSRLGLEWESVSRHKRIERSESFDDASLQLGQQGCPEPLEREQYRHCRAPA